MVKKIIEEKKSDSRGLKEALDEIKERFGEGAIMKLKDIRSVDIDVIPTGSMAMDFALGVGGVTRGRVI